MRSAGHLARAPFQARHYRALARLPLVGRGPGAFLWRYLTGRGAYPYVVTVRTPVGPQEITAYDPVDMATINEVFFRGDYRVGRDLRTVVDVGGNIGVSALYFLTRNGESRVWVYEPNPATLPKLRANLRGYEERVTIHEAAVGVEDGTVSFSVEPTGRYGGIEADTGESITVRCRHVNAVVREVVEQAGDIDLLKVDIEGYEFKTLNRLDPALAARVRCVYFESPRPRALLPELFAERHAGGISRLVRRTSADAARAG
jgi:FkbM family methyltransferase